MNNLIQARQVRKSYFDGAREVEVLQEVNFNLDPHEMLAIIGASGSGKSTLLHILGGLETPDSGMVEVANENLQALSPTKLAQWRNQNLGFVYQFHHLLAEFSALENIALPCLIAGKSTAKAKDRAMRLLERVGLSERAHHLPSQLSGGERQRVAIARALANEPQLVLADEPTGNLDEDTAALIYGLMRELNREFGTAFVIVTHDFELAKALPKRLAMNHGHLIEAPQ